MVTLDIELPDVDRLVSLGAPIDFTPALKVCEQILVSAAKDCFRLEQDPWGNPWKPLKRPYRVKGGKRYKAKILQDTGKLRASITSAFAPGSVRRSTPTSLSFGSNLAYAGFQNDGTRTIPARPFIGLSDLTIKRIDDVCASHAAAEIENRLGRAI
jgi:phage gpG-like protein